jgi:hypothetical protein
MSILPLSVTPTYVHQNSRRDIETNIRTYADTEFCIQNESQNNTLELGTGYLWVEMQYITLSKEQKSQCLKTSFFRDT